MLDAHSCNMSLWITLLFQIQPNTIKRWLMTIVGYFLFLLSNNKSYNLRFVDVWNKKTEKNWKSAFFRSSRKSSLCLVYGAYLFGLCRDLLCVLNFRILAPQIKTLYAISHHNIGTRNSDIESEKSINIIKIVNLCTVYLLCTC